MIYDFVTIPFNDQDEESLKLWFNFFLLEDKNPKAKSLEKILMKYENEKFDCVNTLEELEHEFQICDLICFYLNKFNHKEYLPIIINTKKDISNAIITILSQQHLKGKKCQCCGKTLVWNYKYKICESCYIQQNILNFA